MRLRAVPVTVLAGLIALGMAGCSPEDDVPTASPTVASPTPTEVATTPSPTATPSPTPTLTEEEVHVAEATARLKEYIATQSTIGNSGGAGWEAIQPFLGTVDLQADYQELWESVRAAGGYTTGAISIAEVSTVSYDPEHTGGPATTLRACLDHTLVTQFDSAGTAFPEAQVLRPVGLYTWQRSVDGTWKLLEEAPTGESC